MASYGSDPEKTMKKEEEKEVLLEIGFPFFSYNHWSLRWRPTRSTAL